MDFAKFNKYTHQQEQECHASSTDNVGVYKNVLFLHTSKVYIGVHFQKSADTNGNMILY